MWTSAAQNWIPRGSHVQQQPDGGRRLAFGQCRLPAPVDLANQNDGGQTAGERRQNVKNVKSRHQKATTTVTKGEADYFTKKKCHKEKVGGKRTLVGAGSHVWREALFGGIV
jgi:hypothetical protein